MFEAKLPDITGFSRTYLGVDPATEPVPVFPTCHYVMGGIPTNVHGEVLRDNEHVLPGRYAAGECACVSVQGVIDWARTRCWTSRLQTTMDANASVYRTEETLKQALHDVRSLKGRYGHITVHDKGKRYNTDLLDAVGLSFLLELAEILVQGAPARPELRWTTSQ